MESLAVYGDEGAFGVLRRIAAKERTSKFDIQLRFDSSIGGFLISQIYNRAAMRVEEEA